MERHTEFFDIYKPRGKNQLLEAQVKNTFRKNGGRNAVITVEFNFKSSEKEAAITASFAILRTIPSPKQ